MKNNLVSKATVLGLRLAEAGMVFVAGCRTDKGGTDDALIADGGDMSIVNMAARIGSMRIFRDR